MALRPVHAEFVTRDQLARLMNVSVRTVDKLKAEGMPFVSWTGTMVRFRSAEAMLWAERHGRRQRTRKAA